MKNFIKTCSLLSNKLRLRILIEIAEGDRFTSDIIRNTGLSQPLAAIYLKQLEEAGLVRSRLIPDEKNRVFKRKYTYSGEEFSFSRDFVKKLKR